MKLNYVFLCMAMSFSLLSCGPQLTNGNTEEVSTSAETIINSDNEVVQDLSSSNRKITFSVISNKQSYFDSDAVILTVKNTSTMDVNFQYLTVGSSPLKILSQSSTCNQLLNPNTNCQITLHLSSVNQQFNNLFSLIYDDGVSRVQTSLLKVISPKNSVEDASSNDHDTSIEVNNNLVKSRQGPAVQYLYNNINTFETCQKTQHMGFFNDSGSYGQVYELDGDVVCGFRGMMWYAPKRTYITEDPTRFIGTADEDIAYCPGGFKVRFLHFQDAEVEEHYSWAKGKRWVTIEAGSSKEVCVRRNLFGCKEKVRFYSRLVKVGCF